MDKIVCNFCGKLFSKYGIKNHIAIAHENKKERVTHFGTKGRKAWNKNLTKESNEIVKTMAENTSKSLTGITKIALTDSHKERISVKMKLAHVEGRAWNIGQSRWNNEPSYPEKFFMKVIENEFNNKDYVREFPMSIYSIDFAWPKLKKAIEIDGEQHERFEDYKLRDQRKDQYLISQGWSIKRISWKNLYNNTKPNIKILFQFIHGSFV